MKNIWHLALMAAVFCMVLEWQAMTMGQGGAPAKRRHDLSIQSFTV